MRRPAGGGGDRVVLRDEPGGQAVTGEPRLGGLAEDDGGGARRVGDQGRVGPYGGRAPRPVGRSAGARVDDVMHPIAAVPPGTDGGGRRRQSTAAHGDVLAVAALVLGDTDRPAVGPVARDR